MAANNMALSVADSGHKFAMTVASSPIAPTSMLAEVFDGMQQVNMYVDYNSYVFHINILYVLMYIHEKNFTTLMLNRFIFYLCVATYIVPCVKNISKFGHIHYDSLVFTYIRMYVGKILEGTI